MSELVDAPVIQGSSGVDVVALVHGVLERRLSLSKKVVFRSRSSGSSQGASGERMSSRCDLLTSVLVDRAYSGKTGNKADGMLGDLFGLNTRVGLVDNIHCCTTAANVAWSDKRPNTQGKAKAKSKHQGGSAQSGSTAGSAEVGCEEVAGPKSSSSSDGSSSSSSETANIRRVVRAHTIRVPLSVGPGFAGGSGPLNVMMG